MQQTNKVFKRLRRFRYIRRKKDQAKLARKGPHVRPATKTKPSTAKRAPVRLEPIVVPSAPAEGAQPIETPAPPAPEV